ncbi:MULTISPECIES: hypothetical protein [Bacillus]|uniref:Uncharacterized protein n=1 Tax=Bacillus glycinifermentans TaxID=1664069 RepID=A0A2I7ZJR0_9BACI|nr:MULTISPECIES: hypothetical protein [Bacillus]AUS92767.1 hypothetical protein [Bacillus glycinifermentans]AUS92813.1 hypothetical protein [Bacillus glycinifermentans]AYC54132.1 hypothetical protein C7M53_23080 [Bacillus licheniformis]KMM60813.1 hypothetical protein ACH95_08580 [Bacillus glycinifermentans]MEC0476020.1 hypothetical protein [Bacillus licheniformis]
MPKYNKKEKERIELFLDKEKDAAIIEYMDKYATTRAGFVRHVLHEYVKNAGMESSSPKTKTTDNQVNKKSSKTTKNQKKSPKKKLPQFGQAFSSKNFTED